MLLPRGSHSLPRASQCGHCLTTKAFQDISRPLPALTCVAKPFENIRMGRSPCSNSLRRHLNAALCGKNLGAINACYCLVAAIPCQGHPNVALPYNKSFPGHFTAITCINLCGNPLENIRMGRSPCRNSLRRHLNAALCGKNLGAINACYCLVAAIPCQGHPNVGTALCCKNLRRANAATFECGRIR